MSSLANWSYTATATIWRSNGEDEYGDNSFLPPEQISCDYGLDSNKSITAGAGISGLGAGLVIKNAFYTEYDQAKKGDYILLGESQELNPVKAGADKIVHIIRYADTFERSADDYTLITAV